MNLLDTCFLILMVSSLQQLLLSDLGGGIVVEASRLPRGLFCGVGRRQSLLIAADRNHRRNQRRHSSSCGLLQKIRGGEIQHVNVLKYKEGKKEPIRPFFYIPPLQYC